MKDIIKKILTETITKVVENESNKMYQFIMKYLSDNIVIATHPKNKNFKFHFNRNDVKVDDVRKVVYFNRNNWLESAQMVNLYVDRFIEDTFSIPEEVSHDIYIKWLETYVDQNPDIIYRIKLLK